MGELVTVIEILPPSNKMAGSEGRAEYLKKRRELQAPDVSLVELDLLRGGARLPMDAPLPSGDFFRFVARSWRRAPDARGHAPRLPEISPPATPVGPGSPVPGEGGPPASAPPHDEFGSPRRLCRGRSVRGGGNRARRPYERCAKTSHSDGGSAQPAEPSRHAPRYPVWGLIRLKRPHGAWQGPVRLRPLERLRRST
jgi:hypothetical protein